MRRSNRGPLIILGILFPAIGLATVSAEELYAAACKQNHVYHVFIQHASRRVDSGWKQLLGDNLIVINDHEDLPKVISDTMLKVAGKEYGTTPVVAAEKTETPENEVKITL